MSCVNPFKIRNPRTNEPVTVPCGYCMSCRVAKRSQLQLLCTLELQSVYQKLGSASFLTLTYKDSEIPDNYNSPSPERHALYKELRSFCKAKHIVPPAENSSLRKTDASLFLKRFRVNLERMYPDYASKHEVKFILVGEYGGQIGRPHMHCILFDCDSAIAEKVARKSWTKGIVDCGALCQGGLRYVLDYIDSRAVGPESKARYDAAGIERPFMSRSCSLGFDYVFDHYKDFKDTEGFLFIKNKPVPLPASIRRLFGWYDVSDKVIWNKRHTLREAKLQGFDRYTDYEFMKSYVKEQMAVDAIRQSGKTGCNNATLAVFGLQARRTPKLIPKYAKMALEL